jgi:hypothetical protein
LRGGDDGGTFCSIFMKLRSGGLVVAVAGALSGLGAALAIACGSSQSAAAPCNENPWQCAAGQTCWPQACTCPSGMACDTTSCTPQLGCIASVSGKRAGEDCTLQIGQSTCGDLQTCVAFEDGGGACRAFCDPSNPDRGCSADFVCATLTVGGASPPKTESVCVPAPSSTDASLGVGMEGGGGPMSDVIVVPMADAFDDSIQHHQ